MEEDLVLILKEAFGLPEVDYTEVGKDLDHPAFTRASEEDDYRKGIDFWFYSNNTWIPVDLTITKDYSVLEKKLEKERLYGIRTLQLDHKDMLEAIPTTDEDIPKAEKVLRRIAVELNNQVFSKRSPQKMAA